MKDKKNNKSYIGLPLGMCFGAAIGSVRGNIGFWLPIGLCVGLLFEVIFMNKGDSDDTQKKSGKK